MMINNRQLLGGCTTALQRMRAELRQLDLWAQAATWPSWKIHCKDGVEKLDWLEAGHFRKMAVGSDYFAYRMETS